MLEEAGPLDAFERLVTEATALERDRPEAAACAWLEASTHALGGGALLDAERASRAGLELARDPNLVAAARGKLASILIVSGRTDEAKATLGASSGAAEVDPLVEAGTALFWLGRYREAEDALERAVDAARREPGLRRVALPLDTLAALDFRLGRWARGEARSREALRLARSVGDGTTAASCLTTQARITAARGDEARTLALLDEARSLADRVPFYLVYETTCRAFLHLSLGRPDEAVTLLEPLCHEPLASSGAVFPWVPDLVESYVAVGRSADAAALAGRLAETVGGDEPGGHLLRCFALAAPGEASVRYFMRALEQHSDAPASFDCARTELCFGERLRRLRRIREARVHLERALRIFDRLGARPWAQRAQLELSTKPTRAKQHEIALTAHERAVVALVRRGARNREIAAALFITPKTVEHHLTRVYRKLGVRSRTELVALRRDD